MTAEDSRGGAPDGERRRAEHVITRIRARLLLLARLRPFRFVATPSDEADAYLRRQAEFVGFDEEEMEAVRRSMGPFPLVYEEFLRQMGHARGVLFEGSEVEPRRLFRYRAEADEILRGCGVDDSFLGDDPVVFMTHQGYTFCYFQAPADAGFDAPIFQYTACDPEPRRIADGFAELLDAEVKLMEENNRAAREMGGYFITVAGGFERRVYPAMDGGRRPLDEEDEFI
jgi:hypothetical protein